MRSMGRLDTKSTENPLNLYVANMARSNERPERAVMSSVSGVRVARLVGRPSLAERGRGAADRPARRREVGHPHVCGTHLFDEQFALRRSEKKALKMDASALTESATGREGRGTNFSWQKPIIELKKRLPRETRTRPRCGLVEC